MTVVHRAVPLLQISAEILHFFGIQVAAAQGSSPGQAPAKGHKSGEMCQWQYSWCSDYLTHIEKKTPEKTKSSPRTENLLKKKKSIQPQAIQDVYEFVFYYLNRFREM